MQRCISRTPSAQLTLLGTRIGAKVAKAVLMSTAAGRLTPEILSEALQSSSTIRGHVQREAVKLLVVRVSLRSPQQLQWLLRLIGDCVGGASLTGAISSLTQRSLLYQVANFGMRGSAASAITTAAVQVGLTTCTLVTSNAAFWRQGDHKMSIRQYRYDLLTSLYTGVGSVAGGAAGAAVGSMVLPGVGTAFGSVLCSVGTGYLPSYLRDKKGPDDRRRQQAKELTRYTPMRMRDTRNGAVLMYKEELEEVPVPATSAQAAEDLSRAFSEDAKSADSDVEEEAEEGEAVWLDFVRAEATPAAPPATTSQLREPESAASPLLTAAAIPPQLSPSSSSTSSWGSVSDHAGSVGAKDGEAGLRSFIRFSPPSGVSVAAAATLAARGDAGDDATGRTAGTEVHSAASSFADLEKAEEGEAVGEVAAERIGQAIKDRFCGRAKYITVATAEELEAEVARFSGADDLMFIFEERKAL